MSVHVGCWWDGAVEEEAIAQVVADRAEERERGDTVRARRDGRCRAVSSATVAVEE